jgi:hypothetical protein
VCGFERVGQTKTPRQAECLLRIVRERGEGGSHSTSASRGLGIFELVAMLLGPSGLSGQATEPSPLTMAIFSVESNIQGISRCLFMRIVDAQGMSWHKERFFFLSNRQPLASRRKKRGEIPRLRSE